MTQKDKLFSDLPELAHLQEKKRSPIGVFDSGIGGLTVLQSLMAHFPDEDFIYLGDTARLPYGTKSRETVIKYSESLTRVLLRENVAAVVVACSTASSHAMDAVTALAHPIPVIGMIEPTARAALAATRNKHIGVIATAGTIRSKIYETTLKALAGDVRVSVAPAQVLVALAEEGWVDGEVARLSLGNYLGAMFCGDNVPDTLILGCTHFPLFAPLIRNILGGNVTLINSGEAASAALKSVLPVIPKADTKRSIRFYATDDPTRFAAGAARFFKEPISPDDVTLMDVLG